MVIGIVAVDEENQSEFPEWRAGIAGAGPAGQARDVRLPDCGGNPRAQRRGAVLRRRLHLSLSPSPGGGKMREQQAHGNRWPQPPLLQTHKPRAKAAGRIELGMETRDGRSRAPDGGTICVSRLSNCAGDWSSWVVPCPACNGWSGRWRSIGRI